MAVICTLPPNSVGELETRDLEAPRNEATEKLPGLLDVLEDNRGMHATDTVDVGLFFWPNIF
ncbi:MAG: hypothetical protein JO287_01845 [Pseudonocardiales bacterium]|nr:hypothetical protein [Pseudonocardiales bacterium]